jgi:glycosyltransferase involved in cell wall biosynthesis
MAPAVTVLMPVYNGERFLRQAIDSILAQTFGDFELVIVDDGSTDRSCELVRGCADTRIRLVRNDTNLGLMRSLNRGLAASTADLVARQDADDLSEPRRLERQVAHLQRHPEIAVLGSWYTKIGLDGAPLGLRRLPCDPLDVRWAMLFHCPLIHSAVVFRRSVLAAHTGFYDETFSYGEDYDLWSRVAEHLPVANLGEYLVRLRISPWSMTATYGERTLMGPQVSLRNIGRLLGWSGGPPPGYDRMLAAMEGLLLGGNPELTPEELVAAIPEIFRLHEAFSRKHALTGAPARHRHAALERRIAHRLLELASLRGKRPVEARQLLAAAWRVRPRAIASLGGLRAAAAITGAAGVVRAIRRRAARAKS